MATGPRPDAIGVLDRMSAILDAFDDDAEELAIAEIAGRSGLPTSTVSRMVADLVREGYLERDGRVLRLGLRLFELGQLAEPARGLRATALPAMVELRAVTGGTVQLAVLDGGEFVRLAVLAGRGGATALRIGSRAPVSASVMGSALVAASSSPVGVGVGVGPEAGAARRAGFEVGDDEPVRGDVTVAAGALAPGSAVVVGLGLSAAAGDLHVEGAGVAVQAAVRSLANRLGPMLADR